MTKISSRKTHLMSVRLWIRVPRRSLNSVLARAVQPTSKRTAALRSLVARRRGEFGKTINSKFNSYRRVTQTGASSMRSRSLMGSSWESLFTTWPSDSKRSWTSLVLSLEKSMRARRSASITKDLYTRRYRRCMPTASTSMDCCGKGPTSRTIESARPHQYPVFLMISKNYLNPSNSNPQIRALPWQCRLLIASSCLDLSQF